MTINNRLFEQLVDAASLAPSADNMQPWEFRKNHENIEVFYCRQRALPTDTTDMFGYISLGAAIQNMVVKAGELGYLTKLNYNNIKDTNECDVQLSFEPDVKQSELSSAIQLRNTNRCPYKTDPLTSEDILKLSNSVDTFNSGIYWTTDTADFKQIARLDANSSYIRLEFKPFHDELFHILRFTKKENEKFRYGLTFDSLEVPDFAVKFAQMLKYHSVNTIVAKLGFGKMVAKQLSDKLLKTGSLCLLTVKSKNKVSYIEAGRALEQLWLIATKMGLSVQPYGVLPQYFTKTENEPKFFPPKYLNILNDHKKVFYNIFKESVTEFPALLLRIGYSNHQSERSTIRLLPKQVIKY